MNRRYPNLWARIWAHVRFEDPPPWSGCVGKCWIWKGRRNSRGYPWISIRREVFDSEGRSLGRRPRNVLVHRLVLHLTGIPWHEIPVGAHLCSTPLCCNPDHLDAQTARENRIHYLTVERFAKAA